MLDAVPRSYQRLQTISSSIFFFLSVVYYCLFFGTTDKWLDDYLVPAEKKEDERWVQKREDMVEEEFVKEQDYYENGKQMAACKI